MGSRIQADLRRKFNAIRHAQTYEDMQDGFIGIDSDTDPKENADPGYVWVRPGNQNATPIQAVAQNTRVEFPDMKVRLAKNPGTRRWEIVRVHDDETERYGDYIATLNQPLRQPELLYDERVFMERLTNLRMYPGTGLTLEVEPGYYRKPDGTWVGFAGSNIDLTADVPGTVDQKRIVLIGIVYSTGLLTSDAQTAVSSYNLPRDGKLFELADVATALNAAATTVKWIGALPLIYGQTQLKWLFQYTALGQLAETLAGQYVAKTGDTMTGPLIIDGTTDAIQLTVQGHSTQTSNLVVLEDSAAADVLTISGTGKVTLSDDIIPDTSNALIIGSPSVLFNSIDVIGAHSNVVAPTLEDTTNGNYYNADSGSYPSEYTQGTAATGTSQNFQPGYWYLNANAASTGYDYYFQTHQSIEALTANDYFGAKFFNINFERAGTLSTTDFYLGLYADNAGAVDTTKYVRLNIQYDSAGGVWRVRAQNDDGTTLTSSAWINFDTMPDQLFGRTSIRNGTNATGRIYLSKGLNAFADTLTLSTAMTVTWGAPWLRVHCVKAAVDNVQLRLAGHDFTNSS